MSEQKLPVENNLPIIADQVIEDIIARKAVGLERYGTYLQPFNQRNSARDAFEEAVDLSLYLKQMMIERKELIKFLHKVACATEQDLEVEAIMLLEKLGEDNVY